jgi:type IV pilus assembly protein PilF
MNRILELFCLTLVCAVCADCAQVVTSKSRASARISYDMGINAFNRGDSREALRALLVSSREDPYLPDAHQALGLVYHGMGKLEAARAEYAEALRLRPKFSEASNNLGILLIDMGQYDAAIAAFKVALSDILYATPTLAEGNMGWAYYQKGDVSAAVEHIGNAVASDPQFCRGYEWLMRIALAEDRADDAVANGRRFYKHCVQNGKVAATLQPEYRAEIDYYLALGHLKQGNRPAAQALLVSCATPAGEAALPNSFAARCAESLRTLQ